MIRGLPPRRMELLAETDTSSKRAGGARPSVSVVVPFSGTSEVGAQLIAALRALELGPDDEIIVSDNSPDLVLDSVARPDRCRIVAAEGEGSPARARNAGAQCARGEWLLFLDSDCQPMPGLIDAFFSRPIADRCAIVAGELLSTPDQSSLAAMYAHTRRVLDQRFGIGSSFMPYALTANMLVRASAWRRLGGFFEGILNGEDVDFCWRAERAGWTLEFRPEARAVHVHRETVRGLLRQAAVHAASETWVHNRWPEAPRPRPRLLRELARSLPTAPFFLLTGQPRRAALKLLDPVYQIARWRGRGRPNRARPRPQPAGTGRPVQIWCDEFPVLSETFIVGEARALRDLGHAVEVVSWRRPDQPAIGVHDVKVRWVEDETRMERSRALLRLALRHPVGCARDLRERQHWGREERVRPLSWLAPATVRAAQAGDAVLHAHFAGEAALGALRASRVANLRHSLTAHAYDIYKLPRNLALKVRSADLVTSGCDYTVRDLREVAGLARADRVVEIVMGVDLERFRRSAPYPEGTTVLAVGRLVEKKGFEYLIRAAPALRDVVERIVIVGDGPLRVDLERLVNDLGVEDLVELAGARGAEGVRVLLERAALLAMPCVVAGDGDRDSMPVVVKEALAMEVPVVCSDEVGLPELVRPDWGRLVPPADPEALAAAIRELLKLTPEQRAALGRAGREFVREFANVRSETAKLSALFECLGPQRQAGAGARDLRR